MEVKYMLPISGKVNQYGKWKDTMWVGYDGCPHCSTGGSWIKTVACSGSEELGFGVCACKAHARYTEIPLTPRQAWDFIYIAYVKDGGDYMGGDFD